MKISGLIKRLQEIQEKHGDLFVRVETEYCDVPLEKRKFIVYGNSLYID